MVDFVIIKTKSGKNGKIVIFPEFQVKGHYKDLMIRGKSFYAVWDDNVGLWSRKERTVQEIVDNEILKKKESFNTDDNIEVQLLRNFSSKKWIEWQSFIKASPDDYHELDNKIIFSNTEIKKTDYVSKKLSYPLEKGSTSSFDELIGTLYSEEEKKKIEWAIGSIVAGDSKDIQKFIAFYGEAGSGKSTILNIIQKLFSGYWASFNAKELTSANNSFALEMFKDDPLIAIQHDGDLSKIEDNTMLNSIVSHETIAVNEKFKSKYQARFNSFIFMASNNPVKITNAKSGLIRRLIDVYPSGNHIPAKHYQELMNQINFELGAIAFKCLYLYKELGKNYYDFYVPTNMIGATNDMYNFVEDSYDIFSKENKTTLKIAWILYKDYCDYAKVPYPYSQRQFKEELKSYFNEYYERYHMEDGSMPRNVYLGFIKNKFYLEENPIIEEDTIILDKDTSIFDKIFENCPAQYSTMEGTPLKRWAYVKTKLKDINTKELHYVKVPENLIVIDFDIKEKDGKKSLSENLKEASKWPKTYTELSKSGKGIHLHYFYSGNLEKVSRIFSDDIEIKIFTGNSSLRRKLTKCNDIPIATINSGLPMKGETKMINFSGLKNEKSLRTLIKQNLNKEIHPGTKPSIDFIFKILEDAYNSKMNYDVSDLRSSIFTFASNSTNHSKYCMDLVGKMKFSSEESSVSLDFKKDEILFFDVEVFPNLFVVVWKKADKDCIKLINPTPEQIEELVKFKLVGFNCRRYDNHILYGKLMGFDENQLYLLSQKIINGNKDAMFKEAYNLSYSDVYDFASANHKQSLKKFEIELGIHHQELGFDWNKPVEKSKWDLVASYCVNDVVATQKVFEYLKEDWDTRKILADISGMTVNDTTNSLSEKIIFGSEKHPQKDFNYRFIGDTTKIDKSKVFSWTDKEYTVFDSNGRPIFPGYIYDNGVSTYRDEEVGEGGYVYSEPGMYGNVVLLDIASMHPSSIINENLFGDIYTNRFKQIKDARLAIKHKDFELAKTMFDGRLSKYLTDKSKASGLASAFKTIINCIYGLTSAKFDNPFRDTRNIDNIVAKRGALFMVNLKHEVQNRGYKVCHIKTDSIKIPDASPDIIQFVIDYGKLYGYDFEQEAIYEKFCIVNDAVYVAKDIKDKSWTATGTQFQVPYVFKTLFSKEPILFKDCCEVKSVSTALYLDMNESLNNDIHDYHFIGKTGLFCPIKDGRGGGILLRSKDDKYYSVAGTKGYKWLESEMVKKLNKEKDIDLDYYKKLVDDAIKDISKYGDFEWFTSDDPYISSIKDSLVTF